jgi:hypothetical protein
VCAPTEAQIHDACARCMMEPERVRTQLPCEWSHVAIMYTSTCILIFEYDSTRLIKRISDVANFYLPFFRDSRIALSFQPTHLRHCFVFLRMPCMTQGLLPKDDFCTSIHHARWLDLLVANAQPVPSDSSRAPLVWIYRRH